MPGHFHLVFCYDATPQLIVVPEKLCGTDAILVDCIPDAAKDFVQVTDL